MPFLKATMKIFFNELHSTHNARQEIYRGKMVPAFETPARQTAIECALKACGLGVLQTPPQCDDALLARVHDRGYLSFLEGAWAEWVALDPANADTEAFPAVWPIRTLRTDIVPDNFCAKLGRYSMDSGSPLTAGTWRAARRGADCAAAAAQSVHAGEAIAVALARPPGHHAGADFFGGYCFINHAAVAAQQLRDLGVAHVAILDVDYHHGNGTQAIFYERDDVTFISIHGDPRTEYPFYLGHADELGAGVGEGFNLNLPLAHGTGPEGWFAALDRACEAIRASGCDALVISLGLDTFADDLVSSSAGFAGFGLRAPEFAQMGRVLAGLNIPTVVVFEGGYASDALGDNFVEVLRAWHVDGGPSV